MKHQGKGFLAGILSTLLVMSFAASAYAAYQKQATLNYNDIKITLDGKAVTPKDASGQAVEPFTIDGTTYLPVRAVADAVGLNVTWDQAAQTVKLTTSSAPEKEDPAPPASTYSRANPAPIGTTQTVQVKNDSENYNVSMVVLESTRGESAWQKIEAANQINKAAPADKEYVLVKVKVSLNSIENNESLRLSDIDLEAFSATNASYISHSAVELYPKAIGSMYAGGNLEGYAAFLVDKTDKSPKFVFGADYDGAGGIWFSMTSAGSSFSAETPNSAK